MDKIQENFYKLAGQRIMKLRLVNNLSREMLAEMANISSKFLYEIETGKKGFSAYTLEHLTKALSIRSDYILTGFNKSDNCKEIYSTIELFDEAELKKVNNLLEVVYEIGKT